MTSKTLRRPWKCTGCGGIFESNEIPAMGCHDTHTDEHLFWCNQCITAIAPADDDDDEEDEDELYPPH